MDAYLCERSWKLVEFMDFVYVLENSSAANLSHASFMVEIYSIT
jgi:hypothetical protein